jgi:hypothetical protein
MPDVVFRDVPAEDLARIDALAARLKISRIAYLRRWLHQEAEQLSSPVTSADLQRFASRFSDLADPDVTHQAWS